MGEVLDTSRVFWGLSCCHVHMRSLTEFIAYIYLLLPQWC
jgi:hypothetical protein